MPSIPPNKPGQCMIESRLFIRGSVPLYRATSWMSFCYALPSGCTQSGAYPPPPPSSLPSTLYSHGQSVPHQKQPSGLANNDDLCCFFISRIFPERGKHVRVRDSVATGLQASLEVLCGASCILPVSFL
jgi:hypothetical protein